MKIRGILFAVLTAVLCGASEPFQPQEVEKRTASGMVVLFQAGNWKITEEYEYLRKLDRELSRLFLPPPGGCRIYVSREAASGEIRCRKRAGKREIVLGRDFITCGEDPAFYTLLAARILTARFGLPENGRRLPCWIELGLKDLHRFRETDIGNRHRQGYYPVLRLLLASGITPDFRALMQMDSSVLNGSAGRAAEELSRALLKMFSRISGARRNALGDYTAGMLQGIRPEKVLYESALRPAMREKNVLLPEADFFRNEAERLAYNHRFPRPAEALLKQLPDVLKFSLPPTARRRGGEGTAEDLPQLFADKDPRAVAVRQRLLLQLQRYTGSFSPETLGAAAELKRAVQDASGSEPEAESAAIRQARKLLEARLAQWGKVERYLENYELQHIPAGTRLQMPMQEAARPEELLSAAGQAFLEETERRYLER